MHSPLEYGDTLPAPLRFLYAQTGYLLFAGFPTRDVWGKSVMDWSRYPELVALDGVAPLLYHGFGALIYAKHGFVGFAYAWCGASMASWNCVQLVNSLVHMVGSRPYSVPGAPSCEAGNVWWLTPFLLGANWHNNHHAMPHCAREGFEWYEVDPLYYLLKLLAGFGLVWNLRQPKEDDLKSLRAARAKAA